MKLVSKLLAFGGLLSMLALAAPAHAAVSIYNSGDMNSVNRMSFNGTTFERVMNMNFPNNITSMTRFSNQFLDRRIINTNQDLVSVTTNDNFFNSPFFTNMNPIFQNNLPSVLSARRVVFVDSANPTSMITIRNSVTGPFSLNTVMVNVDDGFFSSLSNNLDTNQNITFTIDTGGNVVTANTVTGPITSGSASISIM